MATIEHSVEPLMQGDHLSRDEFLRRWEAHSDIKKAELIWGIAYMPAPLSADHGTTDSDVNYLHQKRDLYAAAGVSEYLTILLRPRAIRWHQLVGGVYQTMPTPTDGILGSVVFPGLWLDYAALLAGNMHRVVEVLELGLKSPDHADFVARLAAVIT